MTELTEITTDDFIAWLRKEFSILDSKGYKVDCEGHHTWKWCINHCPAQSSCSAVLAMDDLACTWEGRGEEKAECYGYKLTDYEVWWKKHHK